MLRICTLVALHLLLALPASAGSVMVHVHHDRIDPAEVKIAVGDSIVFHNLDEMPGGHTVVAEDGSFESPALGKDEQWTHSFEKQGTYEFYVKQHPDNKGKVIVE
jgi:plastocyanin